MNPFFIFFFALGVIVLLFVAIAFKLVARKIRSEPDHPNSRSQVFVPMLAVLLVLAYIIASAIIFANAHNSVVATAKVIDVKGSNTELVIDTADGDLYRVTLDNTQYSGKFADGDEVLVIKNIVTGKIETIVALEESLHYPDVTQPGN